MTTLQNLDVTLTAHTALSQELFSMCVGLLALFVLSLENKALATWFKLCLNIGKFANRSEK